MDSLVNSSKRNKKHQENGFVPCQGEVIMMIADDCELHLKRQHSPTQRENHGGVAPANRVRLSSTGDSSLTSTSTPYSVPSIKGFLDEDIPTPVKENKHRRNRHVFASSCSQSSTRSVQKPEKSTHRRRRRNRALNEMDFESLIGFSLFGK
eukprot:CAMPEP_0178753984 /NCGR_PEP_ID=MMETSP0744-20121128/11917_1 /TAXON_ID=913974 /ORGANISM="Nitzschia punctata, Strain CCMP561" /LENGTH=150 /DNA_ID=CAMNT_0020407865 /DNA_START=52 /DNA_END=504 /DNA_ORIENTATION=-